MYNSIGNILQLTTFGESHGKAVGGILDGCPSGIRLDSDLLQRDLERRQVGDKPWGIDFEEFATPRREPDYVDFLSGLIDGTTLGTPIAFSIGNSDIRPADYQQLSHLYRPLHADRTWEQRFGTRDPRGGGRASARETVARVVGGVFAKTLLNNHGISIEGRIQSIGGHLLTSKEAAMEAKAYLSNLKQNGDTTGGVITCTMHGLPAGIGNPVFDRLQSRLAATVMSIPSVRGFEFGSGFRSAQSTGSQYINTAKEYPDGILGGISDGNDITIAVAMHPVCTLAQGITCSDAQGGEHHLKPNGRHDVCHIPRSVVIVEAMTALVIADLILERHTNTQS